MKKSTKFADVQSAIKYWEENGGAMFYYDSISDLLRYWVVGEYDEIKKYIGDPKKSTIEAFKKGGLNKRQIYYRMRDWID